MMPEANDQDFLPSSTADIESIDQLSGTIGDTKHQTNELSEIREQESNNGAEWAETIGSGLKHSAAEFNKSILSGQLPEISLVQLAPKVELHKLRGPSLFFGIGQYRQGDEQTKAWNVPSFSEVYIRSKTNLAVFSANYMVLSLIIALCFSITNMGFLFSMVALALMWNYVLKLNSDEDKESNDTEGALPITQRIDVKDNLNSGRPLVSMKTIRMVGAYAMTVLLFWYFASSLLWYILSYSALMVSAHAIFRNNYRYLNPQSGEADTIHSAIPTNDQQLEQMQNLAQVGSAISVLTGAVQGMGSFAEKPPAGGSESPKPPTILVV